MEFATILIANYDLYNNLAQKDNVDVSKSMTCFFLLLLQMSQRTLDMAPPPVIKGLRLMMKSSEPP